MWIVQGKTFQNYIYNNYSCTFLWTKVCSLFLRVNYAKHIYGCDLNEKIILLESQFNFEVIDT